DKFYLTFLPKHYNNKVRYSISNAIGEREFTLRMLGENNLEIAKSILTGLDSIRSISQGQIPIYKRWQGKTIEQIAEDLKQTIDNAPMPVLSFLEKYKAVSDEIGEYMNIRNKMVQDFEDSFVNKALENLGEKYRVLEEVRQKLSFRTGQEWRLWNMYMPHMDALNEVFDERALVELADLWGEPGRKVSALFARKRKGSIFEAEEDPTLAYGVLRLGLDYLKGTDEIAQRSLRQADLLVKMDRETRKEFFEWLIKGNTLTEDERIKYQKLINKPILTEQEHQELLKLQAKARAGLSTRLLINRPISLSAFENYPRLKSFFEEMARNKYITTHLADESSIVIYDFHTIYGRSAKSEEAKERIAEIILEETGEMDVARDLAMKDMAKGLRRFFVIDGDSYELLNEISNRWFKRRGDLNLQVIRDAVRFWKFTVTAGTRFIPWRLANSFGDFFFTTIQDPLTLRYLSEAINTSVEIASRGRIPEGSKIDLSTSILSGTFNPDLIPVIGQVRFFEGTIFQPILEIINKISTVAELTPKIASILANLERVERGQTPNFIGAIRGIKEMYKAGGDWAKIAIYERGADINIDYSNIPPEFRRYFSDLLAPFGYWFVRTFSKWLDMFMTREGFLRATAFAVAPFVAMYYWNTSDEEREKVWRGLPTWLKFHSIVAGFDVDERTGQKKPIIMRFYTGGDWVADLLGFDNALELAQRVQTGELTPQKAALTYLFGAPINVAKKFSGLLNPIVQAFIMMATNKDTFRGTKIVDDEIFNTPEGKKLVFQYAFNYALLSPLIPAMSVGHTQALDFLTEFYSTKDLDMVKEFSQEYLDRLLNPARGFLIEPERVDYYMSRAALQEYYRLQGRQEEFLEGIFQDLKRNNYESIKQKLRLVEDGKIEGVTPQRVWQYFQRPSFKRRYLKEVILPKIKDEMMREQINLLINYYDTYEKMNKQARRELRPIVGDYFQELNKILYGYE
ncbi:MAG: hypothetical protein ABIL76_08635, partial [candidate division WOR-3 bacterium]